MKSYLYYHYCSWMPFLPWIFIRAVGVRILNRSNIITHKPSRVKTRSTTLNQYQSGSFCPQVSRNLWNPEWGNSCSVLLTNIKMRTRNLSFMNIYLNICICCNIPCLYLHQVLIYYNICLHYKINILINYSIVLRHKTRAGNSLKMSAHSLKWVQIRDMKSYWLHCMNNV